MWGATEPVRLRQMDSIVIPVDETAPACTLAVSNFNELPNTWMVFYNYYYYNNNTKKNLKKNKKSKKSKEKEKGKENH